MRSLRKSVIYVSALVAIFGFFVVTSYQVASGGDDGTQTSDDQGGRNRSAERIIARASSNGVPFEVVEYTDGVNECVDVRIVRKDGSPVGSVGGCNPAGVFDAALDEEGVRNAISVSGTIADPDRSAAGWVIAAVVSGCDCDAAVEGGSGHGQTVRMQAGVGVHVQTVALDNALEPSAKSTDAEQSAQAADRQALDKAITGFRMTERSGRSSVVKV